MDGGCHHTGPASQVLTKLGAVENLSWNPHYDDTLVYGGCTAHAPHPHGDGVGW